MIAFEEYDDAYFDVDQFDGPVLADREQAMAEDGYTSRTAWKPWTQDGGS